MRKDMQVHADSLRAQIGGKAVAHQCGKLIGVIEALSPHDGIAKNDHWYIHILFLLSLRAWVERRAQPVPLVSVLTKRMATFTGRRQELL